MLDEESRQRQEAAEKMRQIDMAESKRQNIDSDAKIVDEMFGFINDQAEEGAAPTGFRVHLC